MNADSMLVRRERMYGHCGFRLVPYTSQGSAATVLKCGVMFDDRFTIGILLPRLVVERIFKIGHHLAALPAVVVYTGSVLIHVSQWSGVFFLRRPVYMGVHVSLQCYSHVCSASHFHPFLDCML